MFGSHGGAVETEGGVRSQSGLADLAGDTDGLPETHTKLDPLLSTSGSPVPGPLYLRSPRMVAVEPAVAGCWVVLL